MLASQPGAVLLIHVVMSGVVCLAASGRWQQWTCWVKSLHTIKDWHLYGTPKIMFPVISWKILRCIDLVTFFFCSIVFLLYFCLYFGFLSFLLYGWIKALDSSRVEVFNLYSEKGFDSFGERSEHCITFLFHRTREGKFANLHALSGLGPRF
jgi:hypothetical protein